MTNQAKSDTKRPPYTGASNAKLTMCPKKLRRHLHGDFDYVFQRVNVSDNAPEGAESQANQVGVAVMCRHCKQNPVKKEE